MQHKYSMSLFALKLPTFRHEMKVTKRKSECASEESVSYAKKDKSSRNDERSIKKSPSKNGDWGNLPSTVILIITKLGLQKNRLLFTLLSVKKGDSPLYCFVLTL